ncbi:peptidyl-tRNA hydrolase 2, mitochondrial-like isoform X2 [Belonocnema kinseyi]|uniref:peptidyl-tRNA hydrolase 2, mitochondrial-like isoform X2 n=1 Tax=Belonocnema kinseyi TaxID=2817044 RepID=UPI00143CC50D|nr:peptidyl-tRNA hydrolase 2, mitochondrial-like isoform X2 [Belonocnema kinseyi]
MDLLRSIIDSLMDPKVGIPYAVIIGYSVYFFFIKQKSSGKTDHYECSLPKISPVSGTNDDFKMVLVVRKDLKMGKGKAAAQCAHAAVAAYKKALKHPKIVEGWEDCGQKKITVQVDNEAALMEVYRHARSVGLIADVIQDAGRTQVARGSKTVCAVGPGPFEQIDKVTGHLKLY